MVCMIWGAVGVVALVGMLKHHRRMHGYGCHGGYGGEWGNGGGHCGHRRRGFRGGWGFKAMVRRLFERLDTTPGQEKAIVAAIEDLRETFQGAKGEMKGTRKDFADAFRRGPVDEAAVADIFVRHDTIISETRRKVVEAVGRIHEALDDKQREEVADLLEHGPGFGHHWRGRGGYR
jgi:Spy/CpxP family protein refolding chaperone